MSLNNNDDKSLQTSVCVKGAAQRRFIHDVTAQQGSEKKRGNDLENGWSSGGDVEEVDTYS